jgi:2-polyprenyl-3-methyl-5-hydroxy-6-metoxy-1,4-benzoquinol methylase
MSRLSRRENWDYLYAPSRAQASPAPPEACRDSYSTSCFWATVACYMPRQSGLKALEIGCAPGTIPLEFARRFACVPYGVDFSEPGIDRTKENFRARGHDPANALRADIFDAEFQDLVAGKFDVVVSSGFIEHFTDQAAVIQAHLNPLRIGGLLIVKIPNYRGLNYWMGMPTVRHLYPIHNFKIMNLKIFREGFSLPALRTLACGYEGGFDSSLFDTGLQTLLLRAYRIMQVGLDGAFRLIAPPETRWTSPYLLFVGRKLAN